MGIITILLHHSLGQFKRQVTQHRQHKENVRNWSRKVSRIRGNNHHEVYYESDIERKLNNAIEKGER